MPLCTAARGRRRQVSSLDWGMRTVRCSRAGSSLLSQRVTRVRPTASDHRHARPLRSGVRRRPGPRAVRRAPRRSQRKSPEPTARIVLHAVDIQFHEVTIGTGARSAESDGRAGRGESDGDADGRQAHCRQGSAEIHIRFTGMLNDQLRGFYLSKAQQPQVRRHAVRGDRRAARLPLLRRAGVQGDVRRDADHRPRRHRHLQRQGAVGHARARRRRSTR